MAGKPAWDSEAKFEVDVRGEVYLVKNKIRFPDVALRKFASMLSHLPEESDDETIKKKRFQWFHAELQREFNSYSADHEHHVTNCINLAVRVIVVMLLCKDDLRISLGDFKQQEQLGKAKKRHNVATAHLHLQCFGHDSSVRDKACASLPTELSHLSNVVWSSCAGEKSARKMWDAFKSALDKKDVLTIEFEEQPTGMPKGTSSKKNEAKDDQEDNESSGVCPVSLHA